MTTYPIASPTPSLDGTAVAEAARLAGEHAAAAETSRLLSPEVVAALRSAGYPRHFVPARWGGAGGSFDTMWRAVAQIGEHCPSAAWVASINATLGRMTAYLPVEGQAEVWAGGPDTAIIGALNPAGRARRVPGGWRVSGEWPYMSGVDFADWTLLCAAVESPSDVWFFVVPRGSYRVVDTWFTVGMRGTGSNTVLTDDLFVPQARAFDRARLLAGLAPEASAPCHRAPLKAVNGLSLAAPLLGAARGALAGWSVWAAQRMRAPGPGGTAAQELAMARAAGEIDAAELLLQRLARVADAGDVTEAYTLRASRDCALAADLLVTAVNRLFRTVGTRGQAEGNDFQRFWRDVNAGAGHVALQFDPAATAFAQARLAKIA